MPRSSTDVLVAVLLVLVVAVLSFVDYRYELENVDEEILDGFLVIGIGWTCYRIGRSIGKDDPQ